MNILLSKLVNDKSGTATLLLAERLNNLTEHTVILCEDNLSFVFTETDNLKDFHNARKISRKCLKKHDCHVLIWGCSDSKRYQLGFHPNYSVSNQGIYCPALEGFAMRNEFFFSAKLDELSVQLIELAAISHWPAKSMGVPTEIRDYQASFTDRIAPCLLTLAYLPPEQRSSAYLVLWLALVVASRHKRHDCIDYTPHIIKASEQALDSISFESHPLLWRELTHHLGNLYFTLALDTYGEDKEKKTKEYLQKALTIHKNVLAICPMHNDSIYFGLSMFALSEIYTKQADWEPGNNWSLKAIEALRICFQVFTIKNAPQMHANVGVYLGNALSEEGEKDLTSSYRHLLEAKSVYEDSLNCRKEEVGTSIMSFLHGNYGELLMILAHQEQRADYYDLAAQHFNLGERGLTSLGAHDWASTYFGQKKVAEERSNLLHRIVFLKT